MWFWTHCPCVLVTAGPLRGCCTRLAPEHKKKMCLLLTRCHFHLLTRSFSNNFSMCWGVPPPPPLPPLLKQNPGPGHL